MCAIHDGGICNPTRLWDFIKGTQILEGVPLPERRPEGEWMVIACKADYTAEMIPRRGLRVSLVRSGKMFGIVLVDVWVDIFAKLPTGFYSMNSSRFPKVF